MQKNLTFFVTDFLKILKRCIDLVDSQLLITYLEEDYKYLQDATEIKV